jgi:transposase
VSYDRAGTAAMVRIRTAFADKGHDAEHRRDLCRRFGAKPYIRKRGPRRGSGFGKRCWPVERSNAWCGTGASLCARIGSASSCCPCSRRPAYSWLQAASRDNSETASYLVTATASTSRRKSGLDICAARSVLLAGEGGPK